MLAALSRMVPAASINGPRLSPIGGLVSMVFIGGHLKLNTEQLIILGLPLLLFEEKIKYYLQRLTVIVKHIFIRIITVRTKSEQDA